MDGSRKHGRSQPRTSETAIVSARAVSPGRERARVAAERVLVVGFALLISAVPLIQTATDLVRREPVQALDVFKQAPTLKNFQTYERALERACVVAGVIRPHVHGIFARVARRGNEKVVVGRDHWLFYRPSLDHVVGRGFMPPDSKMGTKDAEGDPASAIVLFRDSLKARGVDLMVIPVPAKVTIYPEKLVPGYDRSKGPPVNVDVRRLAAALERRGVAVFDPTEVLWEAKARAAEPLYLPQDTHWSPAGMALVARAAARVIRRGGALAGARSVRYRVEPVSVENRGDLYDMLDVAAAAHGPIADTVIEQVYVQGTGEPCRPDPRSPVLLLGDSLTNVFSDRRLHWGESAGLAEHLALYLRAAIDVIALNDGGVNRVRERLARSPAMLKGKRLVIWQFAARDLTAKAGQWKRVAVTGEASPRSQAEPSAPAPPRAPEQAPLAVVGKILIASRVPEPGTAPYTECLTYVKYRVVSVERGDYEHPELVAVYWGMRDNKLTPAARYEIGDRHRLDLEPFSRHPELARVMQADDTNDYELTPYWVVRCLR